MSSPNPFVRPVPGRDDRHLELLLQLRDTVRPVMLASGWPADGSIAAARVVVDVLGGCGFPAKPLSSVLRVEQDGTDRSATLGGAGGGRLYADGRWSGHLVVVSGRYLVDLTADQVRGVGPVVVTLPDVGPASHVHVGAHNLSWTPLPADTSYERAADWVCDTSGPVTKLRDQVLAEALRAGYGT